ncbi:hypothetical protein Tco_1458197 [Tanacetum coccineum]
MFDYLRKREGPWYRQIEAFIRHLFTSQFWSLLSHKESLWVKWIHTYKLNGRTFWEIPLRGKISWGWRKILQVRQLVRPFIWYRLGNGAMTSAWFDNWCSIGPIEGVISNRDIYSAGFRLNAKIQEDDECADVDSSLEVAYLAYWSISELMSMLMDTGFSLVRVFGAGLKDRLAVYTPMTLLRDDFEALCTLKWFFPIGVIKSVNSREPTLSSRPTNVEVPKELPKVSMVNTSLKKLKHHLAGFDVCLKLETELQTDFIEKEIYDKLFKSFTTLEKHCISLEVDSQLNQEIFQRDNSVSNQSALSFDQLFELNELKA